MKKSLSARLDRIVREVRRRGVLDMVTFCNVLDYCPSSFYNYKKLILARYADIVFESGNYVSVPEDTPIQVETKISSDFNSQTDLNSLN